MRFRATLTILLAVLLLGSSSFASACQLSCTFRHGAGPGCRQHGAASTTPEHPTSMPGCSMAASHGSAHAQAPASCTQSSCRHQPQLLAGVVPSRASAASAKWLALATYPVLLDTRISRRAAPIGNAPRRTPTVSHLPDNTSRLAPVGPAAATLTRPRPAHLPHVPARIPAGSPPSTRTHAT